MIDLRNEKVLTLAAAAKALPAVNGKAPHVASLWRWCRRGINGIRLEYARLGRRMVTSQEALNRFINAVAAADEEAMRLRCAFKSPITKAAQPAQRERAISDAEKELARFSIK